MLLMTGICVDLAQKNDFSFFCSFLHSQPLNGKGVLQPLVSKDLGQFSAVPLPLVPHFSKIKIQRGG